MTTIQFQLSWQEYYEAERFLHRKLGLLSVPFIRRWRLKRRWERKTILQALHQATFSREGIHYLLADIESNLNWRYFQHWTETADGFLLIYGQEVFNLIPKRAFSDSGAIDEFRQLISSRLRAQ